MQVLESLGIVSDNKNISITKQMKILLLVPKYNFSKDKYHDYTFPIGLGYVSSALKNAGYEVSCVNLNQIYGDVKDIVKEILDKDDYDVVCTGGNDFIYLTTKSMIETVREHPSKPMFILAGPLLTHEPELIFKDLRPDFGVIGEGEESIMELLDCIERNGDLNQVEGIIYPDQTGKIIKTKRREPIRDINVLPFPDYESFGFDEHLKHMHCNDLYHNHCLDYPRTYCLLGSRGCAFNCTFCWHSENYRWRSVDNIMDELRIVVKKYDINNLLIADDCFSVKQERVYEFCKKIKELSNEVGWNIKWTCQLLVHTVDNKLLETMKDAGCESISYGFETMNPNVLRSMMKPITPEQIDRAWRSTITAKIALQGHFIFGDSAETIESARDTLNYWKNNCNGQIGLAFIQPYPGSVMYQRCIQKGIIKDRLDYIKTQQNPHNCINMTDKMSDSELLQFQKDMLEAYSRYVNFVRPTSLRKMGKNNYVVRVKCPSCKEVNTYKNCFIKKRFSYGFNITCRKCYVRFFVVSAVQKLAYKHYSKTRAIRDAWKKILKLDRRETRS